MSVFVPRCRICNIILRLLSREDMNFDTLLEVYAKSHTHRPAASISYKKKRQLFMHLQVLKKHEFVKESNKGIINLCSFQK